MANRNRRTGEPANRYAAAPLTVCPIALLLYTTRLTLCWRTDSGTRRSAYTSEKYSSPPKQRQPQTRLRRQDNTGAACVHYPFLLGGLGLYSAMGGWRKVLLAT